MGALKFLTAMGCSSANRQAFFEFLQDLAEDADDARRVGGD